MNVIEGALTPPYGRFALVAARFNHFVVKELVAGALEGFKRQGVDEGALDLVWVPGSFEIPLVARRLARSRQYDAVIALGAIIRGETDHYDYVAAETAKGIAWASLDADLPVIFAVLTCDTLEQAINRAGGKAGNKGLEAAQAALEMASLMRQLPQAGQLPSPTDNAESNNDGTTRASTQEVAGSGRV
jgi:6,7-dimethyl-8-ribityllumazine synthase